MLDFAKLLHDAFAANWPKTFIVLAAIVGAVLFGGIAFLIVRASQNALARERVRVESDSSPEPRSNVSQEHPTDQDPVRPSPATRSARQQTSPSTVPRRSEPAAAVNNYTQNIGGSNNIGLQGNITVAGQIPNPRRTLSRRQLEVLTRELTAEEKPTVGIVSVASSEDDGEIGELTQQLQNAFAQAGWQLETVTVGQMLGGTYDGTTLRRFNGDGLHCGINAKSKDGRAAFDALQKAGVQCAEEFVNPEPNEALRIVVGWRGYRQRFQ